MGVSCLGHISADDCCSSRGWLVVAACSSSMGLGILPSSLSPFLFEGDEKRVSFLIAQLLQVGPGNDQSDVVSFVDHFDR